MNSINNFNGILPCNMVPNAEFDRSQNQIGNNYDYYEEDDVFSGNGNATQNSTNTDKLLNSFLAATNSNDRFLLNNELSNYNDNFDNLSSLNELSNNNFNSLQNKSFDVKSRHHSLFSNSKILANYNLQQSSNFLAKNMNSLNDFSSKKRTNSFDLNGSHLSPYHNFPLNNLASMHTALQTSPTYQKNANHDFSSPRLPTAQQLRSLQSSNYINSPAISTASGDFTMPNYISSMQSSNQIMSNSKPLRSERLPSNYIEEVIKQAKLRRKSGGKKEVCVFCRNNGEKEQFYTSHTLKDSANKVSCPILRLYQCPICHATADNAHTIKYCPCAEKDNGSFKLYKDSRMNTAVMLMNSLANNTPPSSSPSSPIQTSINKQLSNLNMSYIGSTNNNTTNSLPLSFAHAFNNLTLNQNSSQLDLLSNSLNLFSNSLKIQ